MFRILASRAWRDGPARPLALALCVAVAVLGGGCASSTLTVEPAVIPGVDLPGIAVRVYDTASDLKAGRLSTRPVQSALECADGTYFEAFGSQWSVSDAPPGACWLTVSYSPPGSRPEASQEVLSARHLTLHPGETLRIDVVTHRTPLGTAFLAVGAALLAASILVAMVASRGEWSFSSASRRPTESLPAGVAARPGPGGETTP